MKLEASLSPYSVFVTLTYSDPNRPFRLAYDHVQKYFRSLRKKHPLERVRFCSRLELGETTAREHGHLIIFSTFPIVQSFGITQSEQWPHGALLFQPLKTSRMRYLAKYVHKNFLTDPRSITHWQTSRAPGIGVEGIIRLASQFASRAMQTTSRCHLPTALRIGRTLYPISRTLKRHFKTHCESLGVQFQNAPSDLIWDDRPDTSLNAIVRRRSSESVRVIDLLTDRRLAERLAKGKFLGA